MENQQGNVVLQELAKLPTELTSYYYTAFKKAPEVINVESTPEMFMRCEPTPSLAAERMAKYWKFRYETYGKERYYRSLQDLSGNGALDKDDIEFLKYGIVCLLPGNLAIIDQTNLQVSKEEFREKRKRQSFYYWARASFTDEYITIFRLVNEKFANDTNLLQLGPLKVLNGLVPAKLKEFHVCCICTPASKEYFKTIVAPRVLQTVGTEFKGITRFHIAKSSRDLSKKLHKCGYTSNQLSTKLGGNINFHDIIQKDFEIFGSSSSSVRRVIKNHHQQQQQASGISSYEPRVAKNNPQESAKKKVTAPTKKDKQAAKRITTKPKLSTGKKKKSSSKASTATNVVVDSTATVRPLDLMKLAGALRDATEYHEATQVAPDVVEIESDPALFLRFPDAATRLAGYWKQRTEWFGVDRAYRSILDLSGNGALSIDDINVLKEGKTINVPDDRPGHKVIFWKSLPETDAEKRCLMYWLTAAALATPLSQTQGIVIVLENPYAMNEELYNIINTRMSVAIHAIHVCCIKNTRDDDVTASANFPAKIHIANSRETLLSKLQSCGLLKKHLPVEVGGSWIYDSFISWLHEQQYHHSCHNIESTSSAAAAQQGGALDSLAEAAEQARYEERRNRKRKMDAMYARRRRARERNDEKDLQLQCVELSKSNVTIQRDNARLENLLSDAKKKIKLIEKAGINNTVYTETTSAPSSSVGGQQGLLSTVSNKIKTRKNRQVLVTAGNRSKTIKTAHTIQSSPNKGLVHAAATATSTNISGHHDVKAKITTVATVPTTNNGQNGSVNMITQTLPVGNNDQLTQLMEAGRKEQLLRLLEKGQQQQQQQQQNQQEQQQKAPQGSQAANPYADLALRQSNPVIPLNQNSEEEVRKELLLRTILQKQGETTSHQQQDVSRLLRQLAAAQSQQQQQQQPLRNNDSAQQQLQISQGQIPSPSQGISIDGIQNLLLSQLASQNANAFENNNVALQLSQLQQQQELQQQQQQLTLQSTGVSNHAIPLILGLQQQESVPLNHHHQGIINNQQQQQQQQAILLRQLLSAHHRDSSNNNQMMTAAAVPSSNNNNNNHEQLLLSWLQQQNNNSQKGVQF